MVCVCPQLDLCGNKIDPVGAKAMADALCVNASLTELNLMSNKIGPAGGAAIAEALAINASLTQVLAFPLVQT